MTDEKIAVYPNPSKQGVVTIKLNLDKPQKVNIQMVDLLSREVASQSSQLSEGEHELLFSYGKIRKGIYSILIEMSGKTFSKRLSVSD